MWLEEPRSIFEDAWSSERALALRHPQQTGNLQPSATTRPTRVLQAARSSKRGGDTGTYHTYKSAGGDGPFERVLYIYLEAQVRGQGPAGEGNMQNAKCRLKQPHSLDGACRPRCQHFPESLAADPVTSLSDG